MRKNDLEKYLPNNEETVPVQAKVQKSLVEQVKAKLSRQSLTISDLIRAAFLWYLHEVDEKNDPLKDKKVKTDRRQP